MISFDYAKNGPGSTEGNMVQTSAPIFPYLLLSLFLAFFILAFTGNLAYANGVTASGNQQLQVMHSTVNVRSGPGTSNRVIGQVHLGDIVQALKSYNNWYQIDFNGGTGWIAGWLVQSVQSVQPALEASRGTESGIISIAERFLGRPYRYGANGPYSFDCSGFTRYVFSLAGIKLPRVANDQAHVGEKVASLAPGDLVFFSAGRNGYMTHVGIYIGNNYFINADDEGVTIKSLSDPWYHTRYSMACYVS